MHSAHAMVSEEGTGHVQNSPHIAVEVGIPVVAFYNEIKTDIEHVTVEDDPLKWSNAHKTAILIIVSAGSMIAGLAVSIQNPANAQIQNDLQASTSEISWTLSIFILVQGLPGLIWSAISEIKGRKFVYISSVALFLVASAMVASSKTIGLVIGMRALQAIGSSALMSIAAATLADIYEPHERGTKMGIYYSAPLLGPALGPILGGVLTQSLGWRSVFWFITICAGVVLLALIFIFKDTFRKERSLTYQNILQIRAKEGELQHQHLDKASHAFSVTDKPAQHTPEDIASPQHIGEANSHTVAHASSMEDVDVSLADVNPFPPLRKILTRVNNLVILFASGLIFAFSYSISYTCSRTLSEYYGYNALQIGLVLLSSGTGSICGSLLGGRWSDRTIAKLKQENGGSSYPEMRLASTRPAMGFLPPAIIGYAWVCEKHVHVAAICLMLYLAGFLSTWIYASTLAYIVDANPGRSSTIVATNSVFRCVFAFVAIEVAIPIQVAIGDGGLYTIWGGIMIIMEVLTLSVFYKGKKWREACEEKDGRGSQ
ncbi:MFS general substrate transporter [Suillus fuscotomentosus]|uniref:MFS general substrate transporter n=1 Tax=Suillus fuscotomentosus TaxID=1912939 RepID=A0AAD4E6T5_9AGAM|nr:MFS general substrate transporter [Suillus fuscotomentosus]KAG1900729.1 MFS general substrate transporter [Suillus fuscotomentosus]